MRKKHIEAFARAMRSTMPAADSRSAYVQWTKDVAWVARVLSEYNSGFDIDRWFDLIGIREGVPRL